VECLILLQRVPGHSLKGELNLDNKWQSDDLFFYLFILNGIFFRVKVPFKQEHFHASVAQEHIAQL